MKTTGGTFQEFNFTGNGIGNINTTILSEMAITWIGQNAKDDVFIQIFNWSSLAFQNIGASFDNFRYHLLTARS